MATLGAVEPLGGEPVADSKMTEVVEFCAIAGFITAVPEWC